MSLFNKTGEFNNVNVLGQTASSGLDTLEELDAVISQLNIESHLTDTRGNIATVDYVESLVISSGSLVASNPLLISSGNVSLKYDNNSLILNSSGQLVQNSNYVYQAINIQNTENADINIYSQTSGNINFRNTAGTILSTVNYNGVNNLLTLSAANTRITGNCSIGNVITPILTLTNNVSTNITASNIITDNVIVSSSTQSNSNITNLSVSNLNLTGTLTQTNIVNTNQTVSNLNTTNISASSVNVSGRYISRRNAGGFNSNFSSLPESNGQETAISFFRSTSGNTSTAGEVWVVGHNTFGVGDRNFCIATPERNIMMAMISNGSTLFSQSAGVGIQNLSSSNVLITNLSTGSGVITNLNLTNSTTSNIVNTNISSTNNTTTNILNTNLTTSNISSTNILTTNNTNTNLVNTNLTSSNSRLTNITASNLNLTSLNTLNGILINTTIANLLTTNTSIPNLITSNVSAGNVRITSSTGGVLTLIGGVFEGQGSQLNLIGGGGSGSQINFNISTYDFTSSTFGSAARIRAIDSDFSNHISIETKDAGNINNNIQSRLYIQNTGIIGINTTAPTHQLTVNGGISSTSLTSSNMLVSNSVLTNTTLSNGILTGQLNLVKNTTGFSPALVIRPSTLNGESYMAFHNVSTGSLSSGSWLIGRGAGDNKLEMYYAGAANSHITSITNGNVGIFTNSPLHRLHVNGGLFLENNTSGVLLSAADRPLITRGFDPFLTGNYSGAGRWGVFMEGGALTFGLPNGGTGRKHQFVSYNDNSTINTTYMTILETGNVGIGTTTPSHRLQVVGGSFIDSLTVSNVLLTSSTVSNLFATQTTLGSTFITNNITVSRGSTAPILYMEGGAGAGTGATLKLVGGGGVNSRVAIDLSTYNSGANDPTARIMAQDDNYSSHIHLQTKNTGSASNPLTTRMFIRNDGNIGIGNTTPNYKMSVSGDIHCTGNVFSNGILEIGGNSAGGTITHTIRNNAPETTFTECRLLSIVSNTNKFSNLSTSLASSGSVKFQLELSRTGGSSIVMDIDPDREMTQWRYGLYAPLDVDPLSWALSNTNGSLGAEFFSWNRLYLKGNAYLRNIYARTTGQVIGSDSDGYRFNVLSDNITTNSLIVRRNTSGWNPSIYLNPPASGNENYMIFNNIAGGAPSIGSWLMGTASGATGGTFQIGFANTTYAFNIMTSGNIGIGTSTPSYQLQLSSDSAAKPSTSTWTVASDERLKENITQANLDICYNNIKNLPLRRYTWKDSVYTPDQVPDRTQLGWIAQEVKEIIPKAVHTNNEIHGLKDCHTLNSDQILASLYGAVQKLIQDNEKQNEILDTIINKSPSIRKLFKE